MLVLTRKSNETITIGEDIEVTVLGIYGNKARIGVTAPRQIPVWRAELRQQTDPASDAEPVRAAA